MFMGFAIKIYQEFAILSCQIEGYKREMQFLQLLNELFFHILAAQPTSCDPPHHHCTVVISEIP